MSSQYQVRLVSEARDPAIAAFGRLQQATFPDPGLLIPPSVIPGMIAAPGGARRNFLLVAEAGGEVIGGTLFHYLPGPNSGFSSFMAVAPFWRGRGVARSLHETRLAALDQEAGRPVEALFIDMVAPERLSPAEWEQERAVGSDPAERRRLFGRLGFRKVDVAYYQPPDSYGGPMITSMDLLCCPRPAGASAIAADLVAGTMHAYWAPWLGREAADRHAAELRRRCGADMVRLLVP